jgi:hypothetical protein
MMTAATTELRAQWTNAATGGASNANITFAPLGRAVRVTWNPLAPSAHYRLMRATDPTGAATDISGPIPATTFTDASLAQGTVYFYQVMAVLPGGAKPVTSARTRFTLMQPVAVELPKGRATVPVSQPATPPPKATEVPTPSVTQILPGVVPIGVPTFVVRGKNLRAVTSVRVGGVAQTWQKEACAGFDGGDTSYVVTVASPVAGANAVELVHSAGTVSGQVTFDVASITALSPTSAKPGDWVKITGTSLTDFQLAYTVGNCKPVRFAALGPTSVTFGGVAATAVRGAAGDASLTVQVPARSTGPVVVVTAAHGAARGNSPVTSIFTETPTVKSMSRSVASPGDSVTIVGTALDHVNAEFVLSVGAVGTPLLTRATYDMLLFRAPQNNLGRPLALIVKLASPGLPGGAASWGTVSNSFTLLAPPKVTAVTPAWPQPGDAVSITGSGTGVTDPPAGSPAGWAPVVTFNGKAATVVRVGNASTVYAIVPLTATTGPIQVGPAVGPVVVIDRVPMLVSVLPKTGAVGDAITLQVRAPVDVTSISFGGATVTSGFTNSRAADGRTITISVKVPPGAKTGAVTASTADGSSSWTLSGPFIVK